METVSGVRKSHYISMAPENEIPTFTALTTAVQTSKALSIYCTSYADHLKRRTVGLLYLLTVVLKREFQQVSFAYMENLVKFPLHHNT